MPSYSFHCPASGAALNPWQRAARTLIRESKVLVLIPLLRALYPARDVVSMQQHLQQLPVGTLGRAVAENLRRHQLRLIPHYENHDLKHVLLGYDMTPEGELLLNAFMLGNGDHSLACRTFLGFALLTPEWWPKLRRHYQRGRQTPSIVQWSLAEYGPCQLADLRRQLGFHDVC